MVCRDQLSIGNASHHLAIEIALVRYALFGSRSAEIQATLCDDSTPDTLLYLADLVTIQ